MVDEDKRPVNSKLESEVILSKWATSFLERLNILFYDTFKQFERVPDNMDDKGDQDETD